MTFARKVAADAKALRVTGFEGIMSDQTQRCYFPTGLPVSVFGEFLFDSSLDIEAYIDSYMKDAFGEDHKAAKEYLEAVSTSFDPEAMKQNTDVTAQDTGCEDKNSKKAGIIGNEPLGDVIAKLPEIVDAFAPSIEKNLSVSNECHKESWRILTYHGEYVKWLSKIYFALSRGDQKGALDIYWGLLKYLSEVEMEIHPYFDLCLFNQRTKQVIAGK
jgi:hypothetical protein